MARDLENLGNLFVSLEPTIKEVRNSGGRYGYQQGVINSLIQEFGIEAVVIVQIPQRARFQINLARTKPGQKVQPGCPPGEIRNLGQCMHLGYTSKFLILRGVPEYSTTERDYRNQWQLPSSSIDDFIAQITNHGESSYQE